MRERKFRAWDREIEDFIYSDKVEDDYFFEFNNGELKAFAIDEIPASTYEPAHGKLRELEPVEEYIGKKDKNNIEIYEGDIVNLLDINGIKWQKGIIEFEKGCFWINLLLKNSPEDTIKYQIYLYKLEIIGNIYENPELIS